MTICLKINSLIYFFLIGLSTNIFSQKNENQSISDKIKTVALYSPKNSFFHNYPIDSIVSNLNSLNTNKKIIYYKKSEDNGKSGLNANYIVELTINSRRGIWIREEYSRVVEYKPIFIDTGRSTTGIGDYQRVYSSVKTSGGYKPDQYQMNITIIANNKGLKKRRKIITGEQGSYRFNQNLAFSNQIPLIIELEKYLLNYFYK